MVRANDRIKTEGTAASASKEAVGGVMVAFGTGRNLSRSDPINMQTQSVYSVLDNTRYQYTGTGDDRRLQVHPGCTACDGGRDVPAPLAWAAALRLLNWNGGCSKERVTPSRVAMMDVNNGGHFTADEQTVARMSLDRNADIAVFSRNTKTFIGSQGRKDVLGRPSSCNCALAGCICSRRPETPCLQSPRQLPFGFVLCDPPALHPGAFIPSRASACCAWLLAWRQH